MIPGMFRQILVDVSVMFVIGGIALAFLHFTGLVPSSDLGGLVLGLAMGGVIFFTVLILRSGALDLPWRS